MAFLSVLSSLAGASATIARRRLEAPFLVGPIDGQCSAANFT